MSFWSFDRLHLLNSISDNETGDLSQKHLVSGYLVSAKQDVEALFEFIVPYLFLTDEKTHKYSIQVEVSDPTLGASLHKVRGGYVVTVTGGLIMAIDDLTAVATRYMMPNADAVHDHSDFLRAYPERYCDYSFLSPKLGIEYFEENPLLCLNTISYKEEDTRLFRNVLANLAISWCLFHEIGHAQLNHSTRGATPEKLESMELAADVYATNKFLTTFDRSDAHKHLLPTIVQGNPVARLSFLIMGCVLPSLILSRSTSSTSVRTKKSVGNYLSPQARAIQSLVCASSILGNNYDVIWPLEKALVAKGETVAHQRLETPLYILMRTLSAVLDVTDDLFAYLGVIPFVHYSIEFQFRMFHGYPQQSTIILGRERTDLVKWRESHARIVATCAVGSHPIPYVDKDPFGTHYSQWLARIRQVNHLLGVVPPKSFKDVLEAAIQTGDIHVPLTAAVLDEQCGDHDEQEIRRKVESLTNEIIGYREYGWPGE